MRKKQQRKLTLTRNAQRIFSFYFQAFTVAKRTLEGQDMIYQSVKLTNGIWGLVEIKLSPGNPSITLSFKSRVMEIAQAVFQVFKEETRFVFEFKISGLRCHSSQLNTSCIESL